MFVSWCTVAVVVVVDGGESNRIQSIDFLNNFGVLLPEIHELNYGTTVRPFWICISLVHS